MNELKSGDENFFTGKSPDIPNAETVAAMREAEVISKDNASESFSSVDALMADLCSDT